jgi:putative FmdB family regulatory protein
MPIYEYRCEACGSVSEYLLGLGNDEPIECKQCGSPKISRILSASAFTLRLSKRSPGRTCCGREERCETPPCSEIGSCRREPS